MSGTILANFRPWAEGVGLALDEAQVEAFAEFQDHLYIYNRTMNLTRVAEDECWLRHFVDSLLFQDLIPAGVRVVDLGTGPGFPAWPLACARPDLQVWAIDSNQKMLSFLRDHARPNLHVVEARAEEFQPDTPFDCVTGRAFAPLPIQLEVSGPLCAIGGIVLPMRTPSDQFELKGLRGLGLQLERVVERVLPGTDITRAAPIYRKDIPTHSKYPRRWSEIKAKPLG